MVLGLKAKTRKSPSVQVDYLIHIQEIKPWPPSQSLRTLRAVLIQWEHGDRNVGSTSQVVPSLGTGSGVGDGRIEFNESFRLPVTLQRGISIKGGDGDTFQKNCIEFNLYEPRRDKTVKGQLLGTATIDLADCGVGKETLNVSAPIKSKRTFGNAALPLLYLKIQPVERGRNNSLSRDSLTREASIDRSGVESVSSLMSEEYAEEADVTSLSEDDVSSHSSLAVSPSANGSNCGSPLQGELAGKTLQDGSEGGKSSPGKDEDEHVLHSTKKTADLDEKHGMQSLPSSRASSDSSIDLSSDLAWISKKIGGSCSNQFSTSDVNGITENTQNPYVVTKHVKQVQQMGSAVASSETSTQQSFEEGGRVNNYPADQGSPVSHITDESRSFVNSVTDFSNSVIGENALTPDANGPHEDTRAVISKNGSIEDEKTEKYQRNGNKFGDCNTENHQVMEQVKEIVEEEGQCKDETMKCSISEDATKNGSKEGHVISAYTDSYRTKSSSPDTERLKQVKSVRSSAESNRLNEFVRSNQLLVQDTQISARDFANNERKDRKGHSTDTSKILLESKILKLEQRVKMLERELREAAAIEVGLYSVVAEHGSSTNKVHAPARRLSRLYLHACKEDSLVKRGSAAKSAVSGIILVAKACGSDVPRLTFWLSNSVVLRATISKFHGQLQLPLSTETMLGKAIVKDKKKSVPLKWESFSSKGIKDDLCDSFGNWEDPLTFTRALEKTEAWIFSRIIESIWWQTLTPHMQSGAAKEIRKSMNSEMIKVYRRTASSGSEEHEHFSLELWKKAFKDACERICPVRAGGHECGCLLFLSKLIMEQCVARLDVAMFNAILRESADEIPSDPISDPISDADVLPIPSGKASFGAGAQLKNVIGNWSRWLTNLFGIDDGESLRNENIADNSEEDGIEQLDTSAKSFHLLNALSDLMMLPKDMLLSRTIRKEVCQTFGPLIIRRVLDVFVPDEFCPDPIPEVVLEALNSEDTFEAEEDSVISYPCIAAPVAYMPPSIALLADMLGDVSSSQLTRSASSVLKKSYTSDEELEQLDSPLNFISDGIEASQKHIWMAKGSGSQSAVRYQLLREVWIKSE